MRLELFEVRFDNPNSIYLAGQPVTGKVVIKIAKATWIDTILIKFFGKARSRWDVANGDSTKKYQADEVYINSEYCLYKCQDENDKHPPGMHVYPFDFLLPAEVPSSFVGRRGYVRYSCLVCLDRGWKGVLEIEQDLTVIRHLDLNILPEAAMPRNLQGEENYEGCCCDSGLVSCSIRLEKSGYVPGEPCHFYINVMNRATSSIGGITLSLIQTVRYAGYSNSLFSSGHPKYHDKVNNWVLFQCDDEIGPNKDSNFHNYCVIPAVAPSLLEGCNIIEIQYEIQMDVPVGWRSIQLTSPIFIGTIPLRRQEPVRSSSSNDINSLSGVNAYFDAPPSYEECVFGRMESQEHDRNNTLDDDDEDRDNNDQANENRSSGTAASRRSRLHRLPSYPYYSLSHFSSEGPALDLNSFTAADPTAPPHAPPPPVAGSAEDSIPRSGSSHSHTNLPPPPSYESLHPS